MTGVHNDLWPEGYPEYWSWLREEVMHSRNTSTPEGRYRYACSTDMIVTLSWPGGRWDLRLARPSLDQFTWWSGPPGWCFIYIHPFMIKPPTKILFTLSCRWRLKRSSKQRCRHDFRMKHGNWFGFWWMWQRRLIPDYLSRKNTFLPCG